MVVFVWDSVVVEGWSSGFVVGLVLVVGKDVDFGELILSPVVLPGDFYGVVRQWRFCVEPPFEHFSLVLSSASAVGSGDEF
ncbi:hypothetical protein CFLV_04320 [Corynebacterium flavescens]|uniref:Uncharacterized protein n=1 Tax=Corynebacterium flavescens TaxID=28028 RepID=A0A1L7CL21_CORFL|nr:hypothetical protein CFLV_04320 [Corynebacterium flavescens]